MSKQLLVTISSSSFIPFINRRGPISSPILVDVEVVESLRQLGHQVEVHTHKVMPGGLIVTYPQVESTHQEIVITSESDYDLYPEAVQAQVNEQPVEEEVQVEVTEVVETEEQPQEDEVVEEVQEEATDVEEDVEVAETEEQPQEEEVVEVELQVYDKKEYESWTKAKVITYLRDVKDFLPEDVSVDTLENRTKRELLELIYTHILG